MVHMIGALTSGQFQVLNIGDFLQGLFGFLFGQNGQSELMPGSSFHALTAAFATQGYWLHADMLYLIGATSFQHFAVLIYMCAIIAGIIGMAMGAPQKMYLWFIMGPAIFHFLIGTTQPVMGVAWKVAGVPQIQSEVWKLAEVGLANTNIAQREGLQTSAYAPPSGGPNGDGTVNVSYFFAQLDGLVSDTIQNLIGWMGVYNLAGSDDPNSNRIPLPSGGELSDIQAQSKWYLLSNLKWGILDTITSASLKSVELRDALNTFMAGKCGDAFFNMVDLTRYTTAQNSSSGLPPPGIFKRATGTTYEQDPSKDYAYLDGAMLKEKMPMPSSLYRLLTPTNTIRLFGSGPINVSALIDPASFYVQMDKYKFSQLSGATGTGTTGGTGGANPIYSCPPGNDNLCTLMSQSTISCRDFLDIIVHGFRWEAGHVYAQLAGVLPKGIASRKIVDYAMFFGWDIREIPDVAKLWEGGKDINDPFKKLVEDNLAPRLTGNTANGNDKQQQFMINLIFVNLVKNEFLLVRNTINEKLRKNSVESAVSAVEQYQKTVGSKNKFGEVYTWAMMMPYLQGTLLYLLAMAYPFACIFVLIPGWHKIIFTWSSFWIWAKMWDLGFAIVVVIERSIWATIGNSARAIQMNPFVADMIRFGESKITNQQNSPVPIVSLYEGFSGYGIGSGKSHFISYLFLDRALSLWSTMDLDLQNSYYIYIMAALYFAVPAVTGQLVLGAKAGVAGLATNAFTQMANETGAKAGAAFSADLQQKVGRNQAIADRTFALKALQESGIGEQQLAMQNAMAMNNLRSGVLGAEVQGMGRRQQMIDSGNRMALGNIDLEAGIVGALRNPGSAVKAFTALTLMGAFGDKTVQGLINSGNMDPGLIQGLQSQGVLKPDGTIDPAKLGAWQQAQQGGKPNNAAPGGSVNAAPGAGRVGGGSTASNAVVGASPGGGGAGGDGTGGGPIVGGGFGKMAWNMAKQLGQDNVFPGIAGGMYSVTDFTKQMASNFIQNQGYNSSAMLTAQQGEFDIRSGSYRAQNEGLNLGYQRLQATAEGLMQDATTDGRSRMSMGLAGTMSAMGVQVASTGAFSTNTAYVAGKGELGERAQQEYNFTSFFGEGNANNGAFYSQVSSMYKELGSAYGKDGLLADFHSTASPYQLGNAYTNAEGLVQDSFSHYMAEGGRPLPGVAPDSVFRGLQGVSEGTGIGKPVGTSNLQDQQRGFEGPKNPDGSPTIMPGSFTGYPKRLRYISKSITDR